MLADLFWNIATSYVVLGMIGSLLAVSLVVGYFPLLRWFPVIGQYVPAARLIVLISAGLLCFLIGFRLSDEREAAKSLRMELAAKQTDLEAATEAAQKSDEARAELAKQTEDDQKRIAEYADELKKRPNGACLLGPDDFSGVPKRPNAR